MSWAQRRKATYLGGLLLVFIVVLILILISFLNKKATCSDGIKNQAEVGIDCGGPCTNLCRAEYVDPNIVWVRWVKVLDPGIYNVLIYAENPNANVGSLNVPYNFKIYDKEGVLLFEKTKSIYIPPTKNFAIFEDGIDLKDKTPGRMEFVLAKNVVWQKIENKELGITTISKVLSKEDTKPRVDAVLKNKTLKPIKDIEMIAILYDSDDNAVAFSKTKVDLLVGEGSQSIVFTWPEPFVEKVYKIEIISKILGK